MANVKAYMRAKRFRMSYTEIVLFDNDGNACDEGLIFNNSWRGAMAIWRYMEKRYLEPYIPSYVNEDLTYEEYERKYGYTPSRLSSLDEEVLTPLWQTVDNPDIPFNERVCMATTLDWVLVEKANFPKVIEAFRAFPVETSLPEQADEIEKLIKDDNVSAIGWRQNSIVDNLWLSYFEEPSVMPTINGEDDDEGRPYNYKSDTKHWFLFDEIKESE